MRTKLSKNGKMSIAGFPTSHMLPKEYTQASSFIRDNPTWDGRGTVIAILDTGVDPGADGLQVTSDGKPKFVDIIDCTGAGDVVLSADTAPDASGHLTGKSGRTLKLGKWNNPSGQYRLGIKSLFSLFPSELVDRMKKTRLESKGGFASKHHDIVTSVLSSLESTKPTKENADTVNDLKARIEVLQDMFKDYNDSGLMVDCVLFHDGLKWRAAIDVDASGDLSSVPLLTNYADERQFHRFCDESYMNFSVNIFDDGSLLSIVTVGAGSHGSHCASIAAAYFPDQPELNGVAPGAQLVSLKIGENRLGSMETGQSMIRACDLANMSYGEPFSVNNTGRFPKLLDDEVVNKTGCLFVTSAGNSGPALTTIGSPGGSLESIISVGAYVARETMEAAHSLIENVDPQSYTWSSRGPQANGSLGYSIYAPGAAIASVPNYLLYNNALKNGTSMASPNCCGCLALIVSGLKAQGIPYNPYRIKSALINSSLDIHDPLGVGLVQVQAAWDNLSLVRDNANFDVFFKVGFPSWRKNSGGLYYRTTEETYGKSQESCHITPRVFDSENPAMNPNKLKLDVRLRLVPTQPWIRTTEFLQVNHSGRSFDVNVDPIQLEAGCLHYGQVEAFDTSCPSNKPLFTVPITVCKPKIVSDTDSNTFKVENVSLVSGDVKRYFVDVPIGANFAQVFVKAKPKEISSTIMLVLITQICNQTRYDSNNAWYNIRLDNSESNDSDEKLAIDRYFKVVPGVAMEVTLAPYWNAAGTSNVDVEIRFHGIQATVSGSNQGNDKAIAGAGNGVFLNSGNTGFTRIDLLAPCRNEDINPSVSLDKLRRFIRPVDYSFCPLKSRDILPNGTQLHSLTLSYDMKLTEATTLCTRFPRFEHFCYDTEWENFACMIVNSNNKMVYFSSQDAKSVKFEPGTYKIKAQLVSSSMQMLDRMRGLVCCLEIQLEKAVTLPIYASLNDISISATGSFKQTKLRRGIQANLLTVQGVQSTLWIGEVAEQPKEAKFGDYLVGKFSVVGKDIKLTNGDLYSAMYAIPQDWKPKESSTAMSFATNTTVEKKEDSAVLLEAVRDLEIEHFGKMSKDEDKDVLFTRLVKQYPEHVPLYVKKLESDLKKFEKSKAPEDSQQVIKSADTLLNLVDLKELAMFFGVKHDSSDIEKEAVTQMNVLKSAVVAAYSAKANVLRDVGTLTEFDASMTELLKWLADPITDGKFVLYSAWRSKQKKMFGCALKAIDQFLKKSKNLTADGVPGKGGLLEQLMDLKLGILVDAEWDVWVTHEKTTKLFDFPSDDAPF